MILIMVINSLILKQDFKREGLRKLGTTLLSIPCWWKADHERFVEEQKKKSKKERKEKE